MPNINIMNLTEKQKLIARNALTTVILLVMLPCFNRTRLAGSYEKVGFFAADTIRCAIDLGDDMYSSKGLQTGFNYELLNRFAEDNGKKVIIAAANRNENYLDSLRKGVIDILVTSPSNAMDCTGVSNSKLIGDCAVWVVKSENTLEARKINLWSGSNMQTDEFQQLQNDFNTSFNQHRNVSAGYYKGRISPYDEIIKEYAEKIGWDWRMLAAVIYQESKFSINSRSFRGAYGLMQVMPNTASHYGAEDLLDPELNIETGTEHLKRLQKLYRDIAPEERIKFTLAAYNAGEGRIADCRNYARLMNADAGKWEDIVKIIPHMSDADSVENCDTIRHGIFKGTETINYVDNVMSLYDKFRQICPE